MSTYVENLKLKLKDTAKEFFTKKEEILALLFICIEEIFLFSALTTRLPVIAVVLANVVFISLIIIFLVLAIRKKKPDKKLLKNFLIFVLFALLFGVIRSYLYIVSLIVAYIFFDEKKILYKWLFLISFFCFFVFVFLCLLSIIPNIAITRSSDGIITNIRHSLGFNHPNQPLKFYYTTILTGYLWLCKNKKSTFIFSLIMLLPVIFIAYNTNSRTGVIINVLILCIINLPFLVDFIKIKWLYFVAIAITLLLTISFKFEIFESINGALSGRPYWFCYYFEHYGWYIIFGKCYTPLLFNMIQYPLDNSFLYILFDGGIFALVAICYLFYKSFKDSNDIKTKIVIISILLYSMTESLCTIFTNLLYVIMFIELFEKGIVKTNLKEEGTIEVNENER